MKVVVGNYIHRCPISQHAKHNNSSPAKLLQPLPPPERPWPELTMVFIEGLPSCECANYILVIMDHLTNYAHLFPLHHSCTVKSVAKEFIDNVVKLHDIPQNIISDRYNSFTSKFWQNFFQYMGTQLHYSASYCLQIDGKSER